MIWGKGSSSVIYIIWGRGGKKLTFLRFIIYGWALTNTLTSTELTSTEHCGIVFKVKKCCCIVWDVDLCWGLRDTVPAICNASFCEHWLLLQLARWWKNWQTIVWTRTWRDRSNAGLHSEQQMLVHQFVSRSLRKSAGCYLDKLGTLECVLLL